MKSILMAGMATLAVLASIPAASAQSMQSAPPGLEQRDTLPPGLEKRDSLPPGLQGRGLEDYGEEGQSAANIDRSLVSDEPQQATTNDSLKNSSEDTAAKEQSQDRKLDELPKAK